MSFRSKKLGWLEIVEPARCGYSGQTSTGNDRDNDNDCDNNDARRTGSTVGNRIDNKVWRNTGTGKFSSYSEPGTSGYPLIETV